MDLPIVRAFLIVVFNQTQMTCLGITWALILMVDSSQNTNSYVGGF
ncbi:MAG: hypothetical protein M3Z01_09025 [Thermoproteota archaeon]|nr:hypothetical protein [Thermoproteota archaeon]